MVARYSGVPYWFCLLKRGKEWGTVFGGTVLVLFTKRGKEWYGIRGDSIGFVNGGKNGTVFGGQYWFCLQNGVKNGTVFGGQYWFCLQNGGKNGTGSKLFRRSQQDLASFKGSRNIKFTKNVQYTEPKQLSHVILVLDDLSKNV